MEESRLHSHRRNPPTGAKYDVVCTYRIFCERGLPQLGTRPSHQSAAKPQRRVYRVWPKKRCPCYKYNTQLSQGTRFQVSMAWLGVVLYSPLPYMVRTQEVLIQNKLKLDLKWEQGQCHTRAHSMSKSLFRAHPMSLSVPSASHCQDSDNGICVFLFMLAWDTAYNCMETFTPCIFLAYFGDMFF
jgi:hypothetical protein